MWAHETRRWRSWQNWCWASSGRYVEITFDDVLRRGIARDQHWMSSPEAAEHRYRTKYIPGERLYVEQVQPRSRAQIVLNNQDPSNPTLMIRC